MKSKRFYIDMINIVYMTMNTGPDITTWLSMTSFISFSFITVNLVLFTRPFISKVK